MSQLPLVCITGTDGAGKTAITDALVSQIQSRGLKVEKVWSRFNNYFSKPLLALTRLTGHNHYQQIGDVFHGFHDFENLTGYRQLYAIAQMLDVNIATALKVTNKQTSDTIIICERGPWDSLVDVMSDTDLVSLQDNKLGKMYVRQIVENSITYLISRELESIYPCRPELKEDYKMAKKYRLYHELAEKYQWNVVDNNGDLEQTKTTIIKDLLTRGIIK